MMVEMFSLILTYICLIESQFALTRRSRRRQHCERYTERKGMGGGEPFFPIRQRQQKFRKQAWWRLHTVLALLFTMLRHCYHFRHPTSRCMLTMFTQRSHTHYQSTSGTVSIKCTCYLHPGRFCRDKDSVLDCI